MGAFGVGGFESDVRGDVEELLEEGGKPAVVKAETVPAVSPKASSSKLSPMGRGRKDKGDDTDGDVYWRDVPNGGYLCAQFVAHCKLLGALGVC